MTFNEWETTSEDGRVSYCLSIKRGFSQYDGSLGLMGGLMLQRFSTPDERRLFRRVLVAENQLAIVTHDRNGLLETMRDLVRRRSLLETIQSIIKRRSIRKRLIAILEQRGLSGTHSEGPC